MWTLSLVTMYFTCWTHFGMCFTWPVIRSVWHGNSSVTKHAQWSYKSQKGSGHVFYMSTPCRTIESVQRANWFCATTESLRRCVHAYFAVCVDCFGTIGPIDSESAWPNLDQSLSGHVGPIVPKQSTHTTKFACTHLWGNWFWFLLNFSR